MNDSRALEVRLGSCEGEASIKATYVATEYVRHARSHTGPPRLVYGECRSALREFVNIQRWWRRRWRRRRRPSPRRVYGPRPRFYEFVKMKRLCAESTYSVVSSHPRVASSTQSVGNAFFRDRMSRRKRSTGHRTGIRETENLVLTNDAAEDLHRGRVVSVRGSRMEIWVEIG